MTAAGLDFTLINQAYDFSKDILVILVMKAAFIRTPRLLIAGGTALGGALLVGAYYRRNLQESQDSKSVTRSTMATLADLPPWKATFAVPMHCQSCVSQIESTLRPLEGLRSLETSLDSQTVTVDSTLPPSVIQRALASIDRDAILRGSGLPNSAAVAILETYSSSLPQGASPVRGLVRMVQVRDGLILCDVGVSNLATHTGGADSKGRWAVSVRNTGDLSKGPLSTGGVWSGSDGDAKLNGDHTGGIHEKRGFLGTLEVDEDGKGAAVLVKEDISIWELVGRGLVVEKLDGPASSPSAPTATVPGPEAVVGVVARSAGVWDNDKAVCSCSGKTVWEEREEQRGRGML